MIACFLVLHLVLPNSYTNGEEFIINSAYIIGASKTSEGNTLSTTKGEIFIKETPEEIIKQQESKCRR